MPRQKSPPDHPAGFKFYPNDWLSSPKISIMSPAEEGAYIRLLAYCWADKQFSLPDDDAILARLSRLGEVQWKSSSSVLRACFIQHPTLPGRIVNARLLKERTKQSEWIAKCRKGGVRSGKTRRKDSEVDAKGSSTTLEAPRSFGLSLSLPSSLSSLSPSVSLLTSYSEDDVLKLWNERSASPCKKLSGQIKKRVQVRLKEHPQKDWWIELFDRVQRSDFLSGRAKDFVATLDWILGPKNLAKIEAGNYDNRQPVAQKPPPPPAKTDPIARGQWKLQYGDPKQYGYD